jgi:hypothetical protein
LHKKWSVNPSGVAYVAPAFHTRLELDLMEPSSGVKHCFWMNHHYSDSTISIQTVNVNGHDRCRIPLFDGLISIPPHSPVKKLNHNYGFTSHRDITFHSEAELVEGGKPFGAALRDFVELSVERRDDALTQRNSLEAIRKMLGTPGVDDDFLNQFISFGLFQSGIATPQTSSGSLEFFGQVNFIQQQVALSASLYAYFGISTLALLEFEDK